MTTPDDESFPAPKPWYRSQAGERLLGAAFCLAIGSAYVILRYTVLPWYVDRTAELVLFICILGLIVLSGRVVTRAFGWQQNY